jgi:hypothetical protein
MVRGQPRWQVGDVFRFPVSDTKVGYGQIVSGWGTSSSDLYFTVFDGLYDKEETLDPATDLAKPPALMGLSMDTLLRRGRWEVVGHRDLDASAIRWPAYKETISPGTFDVVDYTGQRRRRATDEETDRLPYREVVAPIRFENAFRALNGLDEWNEAYDALLPVTEDRTSGYVFRDS